MQVTAPQANNLNLVRELVAAVASGARTLGELADSTALSRRQARYYLQAARILLCVQGEAGQYEIAPGGAALLATAPSSSEERATWRKLMNDPSGVFALVGNLFNAQMTATRIVTTLLERGLSPDTAKRRAGTLLRWRAQAAEPQQLELPQGLPVLDSFGFESSEADENQDELPSPQDGSVPAVEAPTTEPIEDSQAVQQDAPDVASSPSLEPRSGSPEAAPEASPS